jgi:hypothetical protein
MLLNNGDISKPLSLVPSSPNRKPLISFHIRKKKMAIQIKSRHWGGGPRSKIECQRSSRPRDFVGIKIWGGCYCHRRSLGHRDGLFRSAVEVRVVRVSVEKGLTRVRWKRPRRGSEARIGCSLSRGSRLGDIQVGFASRWRHCCGWDTRRNVRVVGCSWVVKVEISEGTKSVVRHRSVFFSLFMILFDLA